MMRGLLYCSAGSGRWGVDMPVYLDVLQVSAHTIVRRKHCLAAPGKVLVSVGKTVGPEDILAETAFPAGLITLDIERGLGVSAKEADSCMVRKPGDELKEGDLIAQCEGALTRLVRSPVDGTLLDIGRGKAVLAAGTQVLSLKAGMIGEVEEIFPEYGVQLRAEGGLVQGEWGNGRLGEGPLQWIEEPSTEGEDLSLTPGSVPVIETLNDPAWFDLAIENGLSGLVTGWMACDLWALAARCDIPVLVLSGFGEGQMDPVSRELLSAKTGQMCSVNTKPADLFLGQRPELIIPDEPGKSEETLGFQAALTVGQRVRLLTGAAKGQTGTVVKLKAPLMFESGLTLLAATIDLADGKQVQVPQQDLVILGK